MEPRQCEDCSLCCKVIGIAELHKPAGQWCVNFRKGARCTVYGFHPNECKGFQCYWTIVHQLGPEWRPDRCKLVLWSNQDLRIIVDVDDDHPDAWRREPFYSGMKSWTDPKLEHPLQVLVRVRGRMIVLFKDEDIDLGPYDSRNSVDSGYERRGGELRAFARYVPAQPRKANAE
jgi:hypothetical protein